MISENVSKLTDEVLSVLQTNQDQTMYSGGNTIADMSQGFTPRESIDDIRKIFNQPNKRSADVNDAKYIELAEKYDSTSVPCR